MTGQSDPPGRRRTVPPGTVLAIASFGGFLAFLDATIVNVAVPDISRSFPGSGLDGISWVLNAYNIIFAAFLLPAGRLVDLLGRKRMFDAGVIAFTTASMLCAVAPSLELLVVARILQALGAAVLVPASLALVLAAFPGERRSHAVTLYTAVSVLAAGVGPAAGGALIELSDWRLCFLVNLPIGIAAYLLAARTLVESRAPGRRSMPDLLGALVLALSIGALTFGIVETESWGWLDVRVLMFLALAASLLAYFAHRCRWHPAPIVDLALVRIKGFSTANVLAIIGGAGFYSYVLCNVLFLTVVWDYSALQAGLALTPGPIVAALVAGPLGRHIGDRDPRLVIVPGALIWSAGLVYMITAVGAQPAFLGEWLPGMVVLGIGAGVTFSMLGAAAQAAAPGASYASTTALTAVARQLGASVGIALLVTIVGQPASPADAADAFDSGWLLGAVCFGAIAVFVPLIGRVHLAAADEIEDEGEMLTENIDLAADTSLPAGLPAALAVQQPEHGQSLEDFLAGVDVFRDLDRGRLAELAAGGRDRYVAGGEMLFERGDRADSLFVVRTGRIEVLGADATVFRELGPGDVLGELAVLAGTRRSAAARAKRDTLLAEIPWAHIADLLDQHAGFARSVVNVLARQLQESRAIDVAAPPLPSVIALVALHEGPDIDAIGAVLAEQLRTFGTVAVLRDDGLDDAARLTRVEAAERDSDLVLLVGGGEVGGSWARFCTRQGDRTLAVCSDGPPAGLEGAPSLLGCDLVVLGDAQPRAVTPWFPLLEARTSHRVLDLEPHSGLAAVARRLTGNSIGLVLSGGGARGLAHIGVLEVLEEAGIVIDRIGGCSMGAFIGGLYATGLDAAGVDALVYEEWVRRNPINDYRLPRTSLIRGHKAREMFVRTFGMSDLEQLRRAMFCVTVDLVSGDLLVHRYGHAGFAIASSMLLPAYSPPSATAGGRLLVDGGLRNNLPVDVMAADNEGPIIAVDVGGEAGLTLRRREGERLEPAAPGAGNGAAQPWDEDRTVILPGLGEQLVRIVTLSSTNGRALAEKHAAVIIRPDDAGVGMLEFHMIDKMRSEGRKAARAALAAASNGTGT